jgi:hypothetical protein
MTRSSHRLSQTLRLVLTSVTVLFLATGVAFADGWVDSDPAESTSDDMENHEASSENPNDLEAQSEDPNDLEGASEDPTDLEVKAEDLEDHQGHAEDLADHEGETYNLSDLPAAAPDDGFDPIEMRTQDTWEQSYDPEVIVARRHLERAQKRASIARDNYGQMMQNNYPRGAARIRIAQERDEAETALAEAKAAVHAVQGDEPESF